MSDDITRYYLSSPEMALTVSVKDIGYGRRVVAGITPEIEDEEDFVGHDLNKILDWMKEQGQVEMMEI